MIVEKWLSLKTAEWRRCTCNGKLIAVDALKSGHGLFWPILHLPNALYTLFTSRVMNMPIITDSIVNLLIYLFVWNFKIFDDALETSSLSLGLLPFIHRHQLSTRHCVHSIVRVLISPKPCSSSRRRLLSDRTNTISYCFILWYISYFNEGWNSCKQQAVYWCRTDTGALIQLILFIFFFTWNFQPENI